MVSNASVDLQITLAWLYNLLYFFYMNVKVVSVPTKGNASRAKRSVVGPVRPNLSDKSAFGGSRTTELAYPGFAANLPRLRRDLFGVDRLPLVNEERRFDNKIITSIWLSKDKDTMYANLNGYYALRANLVLVPQVPRPNPNGYRHTAHRSAHRLFVECPCGRRIPVGRLSQHKH